MARLTRGWRKLSGRLVFERDHDPADTILVVGSGRSGTTWVADLLNFDGRHRIIFEPFFPGRVRECEDFVQLQYLAPTVTDPTYTEPAAKILAGRVRGWWVDGNNRSHFPSQRIVKDIRANLLLGWLHARFPDVRKVLLIRHPCAVARSQRRAGWPGLLDLLLGQSELVEDHLGPVEPLLRDIHRTGSHFEQLVAQWCVLNYVPLRQLEPGAVHVAAYEHLVTDPGREIDRLFRFVGLEPPTEVDAALGRPSSMTHAESAILRGQDLVGAWRAEVTVEETRRAVELLRRFGLDRIYGESAMPAAAGLEDLPQG